jgi:hypothetical protein
MASVDRGQVGEECGVLVPLWEWAVQRDCAGGSAGLSMTLDGAVQALAGALMRGGRPRSGVVVPVVLAEPLHRVAYYVRGMVEQVAVFDGRAIVWT